MTFFQKIFPFISNDLRIFTESGERRGPAGSGARRVYTEAAVFLPTSATAAIDAMSRLPAIAKMQASCSSRPGTNEKAVAIR